MSKNEAIQVLSDRASGVPPEVAEVIAAGIQDVPQGELRQLALEH